MINAEFYSFMNYVKVIVLIYVAQTLFKISATRKDGTFDWKKLLYGIFDYSIYFLGILAFFYAGTLIPNAEILPIGNKKLTITDALESIAYVLIAIQSAKAFKNIKDTFNVKDEDVSVNNINSVQVGKNG